MLSVKLIIGKGVHILVCSHHLQRHVQFFGCIKKQGLTAKFKIHGQEYF